MHAVSPSQFMPAEDRLYDSFPPLKISKINNFECFCLTCECRTAMTGSVIRVVVLFDRLLSAETLIHIWVVESFNWGAHCFPPVSLP